jgi:hypothetical protein
MKITQTDMSYTFLPVIHKSNPPKPSPPPLPLPLLLPPLPLLLLDFPVGCDDDDDDDDEDDDDEDEELPCLFRLYDNIKSLNSTKSPRDNNKSNTSPASSSTSVTGRGRKKEREKEKEERVKQLKNYPEEMNGQLTFSTFNNIFQLGHSKILTVQESNTVQQAPLQQEGNATYWNSLS